MAKSAFDPEAFMHQEVEGAHEDHYTPVPEGEYGGSYIDTVEATTVGSGESARPVLNLQWAITDDEVKEEIDMEKPLVRQTLWLDFDDNGVLSFGTNKNVKLGEVRTATGQNDDGSPWAPSMLQGAGPCVIRVGHRYNKETGEGPYAEVRAVAAE